MTPYRRRRVTFYRGSRNKYSVEQTGGNVITNESGTALIGIVRPSDTEGMRKVKNITINLAASASTSATVGNMFYALVYVPAGTVPSSINWSTTGAPFYEPNQFVITCGVFDSDSGPNRIFVPLARNLNSGDSVQLILRSAAGAANQAFHYVVRYAITLN